MTRERSGVRTLIAALEALERKVGARFKKRGTVGPQRRLTGKRGCTTCLSLSAQSPGSTTSRFAGHMTASGTQHIVMRDCCT